MVTKRTAPATPTPPGPFATADDVVARWRALDTEERDRADILLADASAFIRAGCPGIDDRVAAGTLDPTVITAVVVGVVKRAMLAAGAGDGISHQQQTAGPYTQTFTFTNPTGSLYLTKADRRLLGCRGGAGHAFDIDPTPHRHGLPPDLDDCRPQWWIDGWGW
jgi:hypothetical protein